MAICNYLVQYIITSVNRYYKIVVASCSSSVSSPSSLRWCSMALLFDAVSLSHTPKSFYLYLLIPHNLANMAPLHWGAISFPKTIYVQYSVPNIFISCISSSEQSLIVKHILRSCVGVLSHHSSQSPFAQPYNKPNIIYTFFLVLPHCRVQSADVSSLTPLNCTIHVLFVSILIILTLFAPSANILILASYTLESNTFSSRSFARV